MGKFFNIDSIKNISKIGTANILGSVISGLFWLYLAALLGAENYGELSYYISISGIATTIALIGGSNSITVLVAKKVKIESTIYFTSIISSIIAAVVLYFSFSNIGISIYVIGAVLYNLSVSELLGRKFYTKYSIYFILQKILFVIFALGLYYAIGPVGVLIGIGLSFLPFFHRIYHGLKYTPLNFCLLKTKSKFLINNFLLDLSYILEKQVDKFIIGSMFGFVILGNYYFAIQIFNLLSIIPEIIRKYILPEDSSGKNTVKIKIITILFSVVLALIGIVIIPKIIPTFLPEYTTSLELIPIISISIIPATIGGLLSSHFLAHEKNMFLIITSIVSFGILIIGAFSLGVIFGVVGLAYSLVIANISRALMLLFFIRITNLRNL